MSMRAVVLLLLFGGLAVLSPAVQGVAEPGAAEGGRSVGDFALKDPRDQAVVSLGALRQKKAVVVVFLGTECPLSNAFVPVLAELHKEYAARGVAFVAVNSNQQDTPERVAAHARKLQVPFPVVKDPGNVAADDFGARRTPEAFVLSPQGRVLYQGRIDDQFGIGYSRPGKPSRRDLAEALDEALAGKKVSVPNTPAAGCLIARKAQPKGEGPVTFAKHIAPILQQNCQGCHRPGQIGPMPLLTYRDAVNWSETIREVVSEGRMPPWHADPRYGKFSNDRRLGADDKAKLLAWIEGGLVQGDERDLPPPRQFPEGWAVGKPDMVFTMPKPYEVPATTPEGGVPYQYFSIPTNFTEDRWVVAAEAKAGAASVVHHIIAFIVARGEVFRPDGPGAVLCGTAPGDLPLVLEPGLAKKLPAGCRLVLQMHYTPDGKPHQDQSSIGVIFAKEPPKHRILTRPIHNQSFLLRFEKIPPLAENYRMEASYLFREDAHLVNFMPHMHLRGKDFLYQAEYPDGKKEILLSVPRYEFGWQTLYHCAEPVPVPKGTRLRCIAHFDNSPKNPNNPDPNSPVYWGDQTWEEMMIGWIDYYLDGHSP
jgi:thiol-disulfide isomerase/thioredoxin/mono/diheme cytochrome c family protein